VPPNINIYYPQRMLENEFYAIEPFITTGNGLSILKTPNSHYMLNQNYLTKDINNVNEKKFFELIKKNYSTLPFCQKWLYQLDNSINHDILLKNLSDKKILNTYPPIYDIENSIVSQFEHTIFIKNNGIINLTKNENY
jgi:methionyl aminopeptidase